MAATQHAQQRYEKQARPQHGGSGRKNLASFAGAAADPSQQRQRLVRLCAKLSGDYEAAEDLAQETLVEAWRHADSVRDPHAAQAWLNGVARNVCLRWQRQKGREHSRTATWPAVAPSLISRSETGTESPWQDLLVDTSVDLDGVLERAELTALLDRAMSRLPPPARELLVQRYVDEVPPEEIAARLGVTQNAAGVRLHRSRLALRRVLSTTLRAEAAAYGLLPAGEGGTTAEDAGEPLWQETRIWCPRCGEHRLQARYDSGASADASSGRRPYFGTRCPGCKGFVGTDFTTNHPALDVAQVLGPVRAFKPALTRVHAWWNRFYQQGVTERQIACGRCGSLGTTQATAPPGAPEWARDISGKGGLFFVCSACRRWGCAGPHGLVLMRPETQQFWRRHPRMRGMPVRLVRYADRPAVAVAFESVTERARQEVILDRETLQVLSGAERAEQHADAQAKH